METYTASLHQHPNKDALGKPQHILRRIRSRLLDALPKQLPLPSFWAPGKQHAAELPSANGDSPYWAGLQPGSAVRASHGGWEAPLQLSPSKHCSLLSYKCLCLPKPAKASWNKFQELEKAGFMSIRLSPGQEGEVSTELALPVLTSQHPSSKCWKGCQKTPKQSTALRQTTLPEHWTRRCPSRNMKCSCSALAAPVSHPPICRLLCPCPSGFLTV